MALNRLKSSLINEKKILQFDLLSNAGVFHGVTLKDEEIALDTYKLDQIHSNIVEFYPPKRPADALIGTNQDDVLQIKHADCQAAIFYDPMTKKLALAHAGWKGLVSKIYTNVVHKLQLEFGVDPKNLLCAISPSLGPDHAEFKNWQSYFPPHFGHYQVKENYFDLRAIAKEELLNCGLLSHHMQIATECTFSDPSRFHSWRRDKTELRNYTFASLFCPIGLKLSQ